MFSNATLLDGETYCIQESSHPLAASVREILKAIRKNCIEFLVSQNSTAVVSDQ